MIPWDRFLQHFKASELTPANRVISHFGGRAYCRLHDEFFEGSATAHHAVDLADLELHLGQKDDQLAEARLDGLERAREAKTEKRRSAVELLQSGDATEQEVADRFEVKIGTLRRWVKAAA